MFIVMLGITRELYETFDTLIFIITTFSTFGQNQSEMNIIYGNQLFFYDCNT